MTAPKKWRALLAVLALGLWAGGAAAQTDDESGWFDEGDTSERPQLKIHGKGQYDPPPPDFRSDPPPPQSAEPATITEDEAARDEDQEDADSQRRAVGEFSPHLAPYGYWVDDPVYGRVWVPNRAVVGPGFRPYVSGGHWELTADDDWLWVSDYPFGWVTFHYGRWAWLSGGLGWGWVPGYVYSPAWVEFRVGSSGYVGWGPAPPYSVWRSGVYVSLGFHRPVPYIFCPTTYVFSPGLTRYVVYDRHRVRSIAAQTYRYHPRYAAGSRVRVRGPSPREARIPYRYVPTRRVIAQPRGGYVASEYRTRRDAGSVRRESAPRYSVRRPSSPSESRYRTSSPSESRYRAPAPSREREVRPRSRYDRDPGGARGPSGSRGPRSVAPAPSGNYRQAQSTPYRAVDRGASHQSRSRSDWRIDSRSDAASRVAERRSPSTGGGERRAPARATSSGRGGSSSPHQQRSRRDDR